MVGLIQAVGTPDFFWALHNEGGGVFVKFVNMRLQPAMFGFLEQKCKRVVELAGTEPNVAVGPGNDVRLEDFGQARTHPGVKSVAGNDEVGIWEVQVRIHILLEQEFDAQRLAARLQNIEQLFATNADKAVSAGADDSAFEMQLDVVPVVEGLLHFGGGFAVPLLHIAHGLVGKHHAPAKSVIGLIALDHGDVVVGTQLFHE